MTDAEQLRAAITAIENAYETARQDMQRVADERAAVLGDMYTPEECRDTNGRYILLDALTGIVQARAVLAQLREQP